MNPKSPNNPRAAKAVDTFVGSRIRLWRMRRKISQVALGKLINVAHQQIQKYEKGTNRVGAGRLNDIARTLNVPVSEFFAGANDAARKSSSTPKIPFDPQAFRFAEAFVKISDKEIRKLLIRLVETMARKSGEKSNARSG
jgi:transcriptional regulator with XRE-family HTH domain